MASVTSIDISAMSRYKDTLAYDDQDGIGPRFGVFTPPAEFTDSETGWRVHVVRQHEVGVLDLLAQRYFGDGYEAMWWCIALANGIIDPESDMSPGQKLWIPPASTVSSFVGRVGA